MPPKLLATYTLDTLIDEVDYTGGWIEDEPLAAVFTPTIAVWLARIAEVERMERATNRAGTRVDVARARANKGLDGAVVELGRDLLGAVGYDRDAVRWLAIFPMAPSDFNRQPFQEQTTAVRAWIDRSTEPVVIAGRPKLEAATSRAERALERDAGISVDRANVRTAREALATWLTAERDQLHRDLGDIAKAQGLPRDWADDFFRTRRRSSAGTESAPG